jgi:hypothetical protein
MQDITQQRCLNHMLREAVARCPECSRFFCRECITEHEDKVLCASFENGLKPPPKKINAISGFFVWDILFQV